MPALDAEGLVLRIREPEWKQHRMLNGPDTAVNLHVFSAGDPEVGRMLAFRDRLRADDADRDRYGDVKRELAVRRWRHIQHYADAKTAVIDEILGEPRGG